MSSSSLFFFISILLICDHYRSPLGLLFDGCRSYVEQYIEYLLSSILPTSLEEGRHRGDSWTLYYYRGRTGSDTRTKVRELLSPPSIVTLQNNSKKACNCISSRRRNVWYLAICTGIVRVKGKNCIGTPWLLRLRIAWLYCTSRTTLYYTRLDWIRTRKSYDSLLVKWDFLEGRNRFLWIYI